MLKRVRNTPKWHELYQSGPSIPPKNKASFLNNDDDFDEVDVLDEASTNMHMNNTNDQFNTTQPLDSKKDNFRYDLVLQNEQLQQQFPQPLPSDYNDITRDVNMLPSQEQVAVNSNNTILTQNKITPDINNMSEKQIDNKSANVQVFQKMKKETDQFDKQISQEQMQQNDDEYGGNIKRQKSIKLNINNTASHNQGIIRKSSDLNKDTFRGGQESQDANDKIIKDRAQLDSLHINRPGNLANESIPMHPIDQQNEFKGRQSGSSMRNEHLTVPTGIGANMDGDQLVMYNQAIGQGNQAPSRTQ